MKLDSKAIATLSEAVGWVFDKAVTGVPGIDSASDLAANYRRQFATPEEAIEALIKWQTAKAAAAGFLSNIGGLATLPIALPANLISALYIQIRMIAAIAVLRGYDLKSDDVRTVILACFCGTSTVDLVKEIGIGVSTGFAQQAATGISVGAARRLKHRAGISLLRRTGSRAPLDLSRLAPLIGGLVAGLVDGALTRSYGLAAKRLFLPIVSGVAADVTG